MAYRNTLQADALKLVAKKLQSSLAVEGELPEDGLAAYGDDGDDLMLALARKLVNGNEDDATDTVEAAFTHARAAETESETEEYLVDDRMAGRRQVETTTNVETQINGDAEALGTVSAHTNDHDLKVVRSGVDLVPGTGLVSVNGNGLSPDSEAEATDSQRKLFSWAEFMAEPPAKSKGRARSAVQSRSLFEWALATEQSQERENVAVPA